MINTHIKIQCYNKTKEIVDSLKDIDYNSKNGLLSGRAGVSLLKLCFYNDNISQYSGIICEDVIEAFNSINNNTNKIEFSFCNGIAGIAWLIVLLIKKRIISERELETLNLLDDYLLYKLNRELYMHKYDFLHGALGIGYYYINKYELTNDDIIFKQLVLGLKNNAVWSQDRCYWLSKIGMENQLEPNICLSHGISSIIIILAKIYALGIEQDNCERMINGGLKYIESQRQYNSISMFASVNLNIDKGSYSRLAWCYGDIGICLAFWIAGNKLYKKTYEKMAIEIALNLSKRRDMDENGVIDNCFCHGTAGIAHFFNRMFHNTMINDFDEASCYWFEQTLNMSVYKDGYAGFKTWYSEQFGGWSKDYCLLEGVVGIGLSLLGYSGRNSNLDWDEILLMN